MPTFDFDSTKTSDENIAAFLDHLEATDPTLGALFRQHSPLMFPMPDNSAIRSTKRQEFNRVIAAALDQQSTTGSQSNP